MGEADVTTVQMEGWGAASTILGVAHLPPGNAWGPEECLTFHTRTAVYRLPLSATASGGGATPQLLAGQESERGAARVDGSGADARFHHLSSAGLQVNADGRLLLLDLDSTADVTRLRLVAPGGTVSTVTGVELAGRWVDLVILPNGYLAAREIAQVQSDGDLDEDEMAEPYWESKRVAVIATSFTPLALVATAAAAGPPPRSLPADLGALVEDAQQPGGGGAVADLVIRVGERRFHCHRAILSARCDYFKHRLAGDAFEDARAAELELPDADPDTFALLLRWLYTGGADILPKQARGVAELADRLLLPELCARALDVLFASVDAGSIVDSLLWAAGCCEAHGGGGAFDQLLLRLKRWYVERAAEVRAAARDSLRALMTQQPDLMLELMEASEQRAVKRARTK